MSTVLPTIRTAGLIAALMGCSTAGESPRLLLVGGTYSTAVTLVPGQNTCTGVTVEDNPTAVDHTAGSTGIALTHAGTRYDGQIQTSGSFFAGPKTLVISGTTYVISMTGQFTTRGFGADITVQATPAAGSACGYQVRWAATKQGSDNVIP